MEGRQANDYEEAGERGGGAGGGFDRVVNSDIMHQPVSQDRTLSRNKWKQGCNMNMQLIHCIDTIDID